MSKIYTLLAAALIAVLPLSARTVADPELNAKQETKEYKFNNFTGIDASWIYQVELVQAPRHAVRVDAPDYLMPFVNVDVRGGILVLSVGDLPRDVRRRVENGSRNQVRVYVSMPDLTVLRMSGAAKLTAKGDFSSRKNFEMRLSGATTVQGLSIKASDADIDASGAAKFDLEGKFDRMNVRGSGSLNAIIAADIKTTDLGLSGATKLSLKGKLGDVTLRGSGAANTELIGSIEELSAECSGAAKLSANEAPARRVKILFSGAANGMVEVRDELSVTLSGASKLNYHPGPALRIKNQSVSRASTLASY
ncbi:MAG: DUF2807 domain-containing protein [Bacteroidales bacterium]|nr:DUF2807 domain-containing protein [Bacteroidales bacterium]MDY6444298.1 DUF2807 domain-containing protein [Bacteroidales bacterium]